jgi:hypothetical protein
LWSGYHWQRGRRGRSRCQDRVYTGKVELDGVDGIALRVRRDSSGRSSCFELAGGQLEASVFLRSVDIEQVGAHTTAANALVVLGSALFALDLLAHVVSSRTAG